MNRIVMWSLLFLFCGCVSQIVPFKQHIQSWKGEPMVDLIKTRALPHSDRSNYKGTERITKLESGNLIYEIPYRYCPVFFEVDTKGIIVDISTEGDMDCY